jgi:hypothetical protein
MKKNNLIRFVVVASCFLFATTFTVLAQEDVSKPISFGLKLGVSSSGFSHYQQTFSNKKLGIAAGVFAEYRLMGYLGVEVDANYVQEGASQISPKLVYPVAVLNANTLVTKESSNITLHTLQVPIILNIRPSVMAENFSPRICLGYSFDFILNAQSKDTKVVTSSPYNIMVSDRDQKNVTPVFSGFNMGPILGLGLDLKSDKHTYQIDVRYKIGMNDMSNLGGLNTINGERQFSINTLTITVGMIF